MVKLFFFCRRRADIAHEQYVELLLTGHVPLALKHHPTMRRYVVNIVEQAMEGSPGLDSIGILSFETLADYRERLCDSAAGERIIARDVARFMGGADAYATREETFGEMPHGVLGARSPGAKLICGVLQAGRHDRALIARLRAAGVDGGALNAVDESMSAAGPGYRLIAELYTSIRPGAELVRTLREEFAEIHLYDTAEYVERD